ncbi:hypothetical protein IKG24_02515 [Candidatus Saccharibacteria bacterium]|nr:hypothetical protein [Candidatus Saccharibacteria bacterium]
MPKNPEFSNNSAINESNETNENREAIRAINQERGDKVNDIETLLREREALIKRNDELKAILGKPEAPKEEVEVTPAALGEQATKNPRFKRMITGLVIGLAASFAVGGIAAHGIHSTKAAPDIVGGGPATKAPVMTEVSAPSVPELTTVSFDTVSENRFAGETANGRTYDYTEYADREHKTSYNAYGYDYSGDHGDIEKTKNNINHIATDSPEVLASYSNRILFDDEKEKLGIKNMSDVEIDNLLETSEKGGELQESMLTALKSNNVIGSSDTTKTEYLPVEKSGLQHTIYNYWVDSNKDGSMTPDEMHIGYDSKKRNNAKQTILKRTRYDANGKVVESRQMLLNEECGYQPCDEKAPVGIPQIDESKPVPQVINGGGPNGGGGEDPTPPDPDPGPKPPDPDPDPGPKPPDPDPTPTPTPTPTPSPKPKDPDNLGRIDDKVNKDIAGDDGTGGVNPGHNPGVSPEDITAPPSPGDYGGTTPVTTPSEPSKGGEDVQPTNPGNDYGDNQGGANDGNANPNPVQDNDEGQDAADENEQSTPPTSGNDLEDALDDIGVN